MDLVTQGLHVKPNAHYWPPTNVIGELQRPVAITKPTSTQLTSPIVAARWAACEYFHRAVVTRRRSYKRAQHRESKSGERSSSASKGASKAPSESEAQTPSESADEWTKFCRSADEAAAASHKAKSPGPKKSRGSKGSGGPKDPKSSASTVAKTGSGKGSKHKGKEAGLPEKPRWDSSYKIPKRSLPDTSVSSGGPTPCKADKFKRPTKKATKKSSTLNQSADSKAKMEKGPAVVQPSAPSDLPLDHWASYCPGDDVISAKAERVEWAGGLVLFQGTRHYPLISLRQSVKLDVKRVNDSGYGEQSSSSMNAMAWTCRGRLEGFHPTRLTCLGSLLGPHPMDGITGAVPGRIWIRPVVTGR